MPNAVVMTGYGPPEVLKWVQVPLPEPGDGQIRIKVKAAGVSPTDLACGPVTSRPSRCPRTPCSASGPRHRRRGRARRHRQFGR